MARLVVLPSRVAPQTRLAQLLYLPGGRRSPSARGTLLRLSFLLAVCVGLLGSPAIASGAGISGPSSASFGESVTLTAHYGQDEPFGCGAAMNFCYATLYFYRADGTKGLLTYCGDPISQNTDPCSFQASPGYGGERVLTDPSYAKYEICDGVDSNCGTKVVTWSPPVIDLRLSGDMGTLWAGVVNAIRDLDTNIDVPSAGAGAGGGTTSGTKIYDETVAAVARSLQRLNKDAKGFTEAAAIATAAACVAAVGYNNMSSLLGISVGIDFCKSPTMPIFVVGTDANAAAQHDFDAIFGNFAKNMPARPKWAVLNYSKRGTKRAKGQNSSWYANKEPCAGSIEYQVTDCDEYPYFSARQGSSFAVPQPSIRPIDHAENQREGSRLSGMIQRCKFVSSRPITATSNGAGGTPYFVLPTPRPGGSDVGLFWKPSDLASPITIGLCNRGGSGSGGEAS